MSDLGGFSLFELFRGEAEQHSLTLSAGLVKLEQSAAASDIEPLMRAAHSIKGAAKVVGLERAVELAHAMEDALVAMQSGREAPIFLHLSQPFAKKSSVRGPRNTLLQSPHFRKRFSPLWPRGRSQCPLQCPLQCPPQ